MKTRWERLTGWKVNLKTDEKNFEYFNEKSFIPRHIYKIHRLDGLPVIIEFQNFGYRYNDSMTKTYPCVLISDKTQDINTPIEDITHIFVYSIDDDEYISSESTKTADVSGFKDFVVSNQSYHVNKNLKDIETVSGLSSDRINISSTMKIAGIDIIVDRYPCSFSQGIRFELPTGDKITIPASDHPWVGTSQHNLPVFIEDTAVLSWNKDLAAGEFYIILTKFGKNEPALIKSIHNDTIEYVECYSRYDRNNCTYFVESITYELKIEDAKDYKFIHIKDVK